MYINVHNVNYCSLNPIPIVPITKNVFTESAASSVNETSRQVQRAGTSRYWKGRYCAEGGHENGNLYYERTKE